MDTIDPELATPPADEAPRPSGGGMTATYDPADNKLRLRSTARLDAATYARVKAAGFAWAPRQGLFVAPAWTPGREDLLVELCGEIGDEDTSLVERAEARADRFDAYSERRAEDAARARAAVNSIMDGIPLGQPILVGHHSERRARADVARIDNGIRKAAEMWETADYWKERAANAVGHAEYMELPAVRHRRIKTLQSERRRLQKSYDETETRLGWWRIPGLTDEQVKEIASRDHISVTPAGAPAGTYVSLWSMLDEGRITAAEAAVRAVKAHERSNNGRVRWIAHLGFRIEYERAMLGEAGGLAADSFDLQVGGRVTTGGGEWFPVLKINKVAGRVNSVSVSGHSWRKTIPVEMVKGYRPPEEGAVEAVKAKRKESVAVIVNYPAVPGVDNIRHDPGYGQPGRLKNRVVEMTEAEWKQIKNASDSAFYEKVKPSEFFAAHRVRVCARAGERCRVYVTDLPIVERPPVTTPGPGGGSPVPLVPELDAAEALADRQARPAYQPDSRDAEFSAIKESLKTGVRAASVPQLFPTPPDLAKRMAALAGVSPGQYVLEPSAGTGSLIRAAVDRLGGFDCGRVQAVEVHASAVASLEEMRRKWLYANENTFKIDQADFLTWEAPRQYDRILMNPPFKDGADIKHIERAFRMLKPGGRLVALCANGPRQKRALGALVESTGGTWEDLPEGTFSEQGTGVRVALIVLDA